MVSADSSPIEILKVPVTGENETQVAAWIEATLGGDGDVCQIATYNPEYAIAARQDRRFLEALQRCELVTADGIGIELAARLQGRTLQRVTGVRVLELLAASGEPIFLLGAGPGVAKLAAERLTATHAAATISGWWWDGTPDPTHDAETIERIREAGARMVAVAYGAPAQVHWIERNRAGLSDAGVRIAVGVGGALDYWSGITPLAPAFLRDRGLEWLYRLVLQPKRWRRQLALPKFALLAMVEAVHARRSSR